MLCFILPPRVLQKNGTSRSEILIFSEKFDVEFWHLLNRKLISRCCCLIWKSSKEGKKIRTQWIFQGRSSTWGKTLVLFSKSSLTSKPLELFSSFLIQTILLPTSFAEKGGLLLKRLLVLIQILYSLVNQRPLKFAADARVRTREEKALITNTAISKF